MNALLAPRWFLIAFLCFLGLALSANVASAAEFGVMLQGNLVYEFVADRSRMIQISLVIVVLGCSLLWWRR